MINDDISTELFTNEELEEVKARIKGNKGCGDDGISPKVIKRCDVDDIILIKFCNKALEDGLAPEQWKISNIVPVPKKRDLSKTTNYRGISISLTSLTAKTLNIMKLNRNKPAVENLLRSNQNGFRSSEVVDLPPVT